MLDEFVKVSWVGVNQHRQISAFRLLALTTEAWRGAESGTLQKTYTLINLPGPKNLQ
jgi:hypothetical protein